jgi:hypothetical protein
MTSFTVVGRQCHRPSVQLLLSLLLYSQVMMLYLASFTTSYTLNQISTTKRWCAHDNQPPRRTLWRRRTNRMSAFCLAAASSADAAASDGSHDHSSSNKNDEWHPHDPAWTTPQLLEGIWSQIAQAKNMVRGVRGVVFVFVGCFDFVGILKPNHDGSCAQ